MLDLSPPHKNDLSSSGLLNSTCLLNSPLAKHPPLSHTKSLGNLQFSGYLKSNSETAQLAFSLQKYLQPHPSFYLESLLSRWKGIPLDLVKQHLQKEYQALLDGTSFLQVINNAIESRQKCLSKIRRDISKCSRLLSLFPQEYFEAAEDEAYVDWVEGEGYSVVDLNQTADESIKTISSIFADMARLRQITIYLVSQIHEWRVQVEEQMDRCQMHSEVKYYHQGRGFYQTLLSDSGFIWHSKLGNYIWMEAKQDPFLIRNVILVDQRSSKTLLEKYFLEIVYPKKEDTFDQAARCFEMLAYRYKPKLYNRFEEEQLLIENYLQMEVSRHQFEHPDQFEQPEQAVPKASHPPTSNQVGYDRGSPAKQENRLNRRGWVFERQLQKPSRDRISDIVESHQLKMGLMKPFNIANYAKKNSMTHAKKDQKEQKEQDYQKTERIHRFATYSGRHSKNVMSEGEDGRRQGLQEAVLENKPEQGSRGIRSSNAFRSISMTKLSPIIYEDPNEQCPDTPRPRERQSANRSESRKPSLKQVKINSFVTPDLGQGQEATKIEVEEEETPLNLSQFYEVFRADTSKPSQTIQQQVKKERTPKLENQKLVTIKNFIEKIRRERGERTKSIQHLPNTPYNRKPARISLPKKTGRLHSKGRSPDRNTDKSNNKIHDSYGGYARVAGVVQLEKVGHGKEVFLVLKSRSIPLDLVASYVRHLQSRRPAKSKIFSDFDTRQLVDKLSDPLLHSLIFDIETESQELVGTIVLSQTLGGRGGKLKYLMEFMAVHPFELVSKVILRVAEELLATCPCEEVAYPLLVDRLDPVSSQFVDLIDSALMAGVGQFGRLVIMEKSRASMKGRDQRERMYVFSCQSEQPSQSKLKMMGNYRSLQLECKCMVLSSNFRLRSDSPSKTPLHGNNYGSASRSLSLGELFARAILRFISKYHLRQLKQASFGGEGEAAEQLRTDPFLQAVLAATASHMKSPPSSELSKEQQLSSPQSLLKTTNFASMEDLLNYIRYKGLSEAFQLGFLSESRFMLRHQLTLVELEEEMSLEFTLTFNQQLYVLHNHRQQRIDRLHCPRFGCSAHLLPTTHPRLQLFLMPADHYSQQMPADLFSYLGSFLSNIQQSSKEVLEVVPSVVLPNIRQQSRLSQVKQFDGFSKLFPERQFYSAARLRSVNGWESYYPGGVMHGAVDGSIVVEYPFLIGLFDSSQQVLLSCFLYPSPV